MRIDKENPMPTAKKATTPTEAQNRFSSRGGTHSGLTVRFQIHQEPFQPTLCRTPKSGERTPWLTIINEFQNQAAQAQLCCVLQHPVAEHFHSRAFDTAFVIPFDLRYCRTNWKELAARFSAE